jgi:hypothetical protein
MLVYGEPWPRTSALERRLGRHIGFAWFVAARKAAEPKPSRWLSGPER